MFSVLDLLPREPLDAPTPFLDTLAGDLYRRAANLPLEQPVALRVIADPGVARDVLTRHDGFVKNYEFLSEFARGRLSSPGGADWAQRARLTRTWFRPERSGLGAESVAQIYRRHLDAALPADGDALFDAFVQAGVEVFSRLVGLSQPLAWDAAVGSRVRELVSLRQQVGWTGTTPDHLAWLRQETVRVREAIGVAWARQEQASAFLAALAGEGEPVPDFSAVEELIVAVMASSETTASVLMWCVECLAGRPELAERVLRDAEARALFVAEVLRLFPPVPFLTRRSVARQTAGGESFADGEFVAVSIVGLHCDPRHWEAPLRFDPARAAFADDATPPAYLPFSRGERGCAGIKMARLEVDVALVETLRQATLSRGPTPTGMRYGLSLRPSTSLVATRRERS
jgi:cytochrome P450